MNQVINVRIPDTVIGPGTISAIGDIAKSYSPSNILIITDAGINNTGIIKNIQLLLENNNLHSDVFDGCIEKPPISLLEKLARRVKERNHDLLIGVGGGSVMDSTKIASVVAYNNISVYDYVQTRSHQDTEKTTVPKILVPTTAGTGSEWSKVVVVYDDEPNGRSYPSSSLGMMANKVIVDPELTLSLPQRITADTGVDALTHAIEAFTSCNANVISDMFAMTAIKLVGENIRLAYAKGKNIEARSNMSVAASLAMSAGMASGPGLAHLMGDGMKAQISHGACCALFLPVVMQYNLIANPAKFAQIAQLLGENIDGLPALPAASKAVEAVSKLLLDLNMPQKLSEVGITEADIPGMAEIIHTNNHQLISAVNCRDADIEDIKRILTAIL